MDLLELDKDFLPVGTTVVHIAVNSGQIDGLQTLLDRNHSLIDEQDQYGNTPLAKALQNGRLEAAQVLIQHGASLDAPYHSSVSSQCTIAEILVTNTDFYQLLKLAIKSNAPFQCDVSRVLPILAHEGDTDILEIVLNRFNVKVDYRDYLKCTALHYAARKGYQKMVSALLMHRAKVMLTNASGSTALHLACSSGHIDIVTTILNASEANPGDVESLLNHKNIAGDTPVTCALHNTHLDVVQYILQTYLENLDLKQIVLHDGHTLYGYFFYLKHIMALPSLIKPPYDTRMPCLSSEEAQWLLNESIYSNDIVAMKMAVTHGARLDCFDFMQQTPLILASKLGFVEMCECLFDNGADPSIADVSGKTSLIYAFENAKDKVVSYLLSQFSPISEFDPLSLSKPLCNSNMLAVVVSSFKRSNHCKPSSNWLAWLALAVPTASKDLFSELVNTIAPHDWIQQMFSPIPYSNDTLPMTPRMVKAAKYPTLPLYVQEEVVDQSQKPQPKLVRSISRPRKWTFAREPPSALKRWTFKHLPRPRKPPLLKTNRKAFSFVQPKPKNHFVSVIHKAALHNLDVLKFILASCEDAALQQKVLLSKDVMGRTALELILPQFDLISEAVSCLGLSDVSNLDQYLNEAFPLPESLLFEEALVQYLCTGQRVPSSQQLLSPLQAWPLWYLQLQVNAFCTNNEAGMLRITILEDRKQLLHILLHHNYLPHEWSNDSDVSKYPPPLFAAVTCNCTWAVEPLLAHGADPASHHNERFAIEEAAKHGLPDIVHLLLSRGQETSKHNVQFVSSIPSVFVSLINAGYISSILSSIQSLDLSQYLWSSHCASDILFLVQSKYDGSDEYKIIIRDFINFLCKEMLHWNTENPSASSKVLSDLKHRCFLDMSKVCDDTKNLVLLQITCNSTTEFGDLFHILCAHGNFRMVKFLLESSEHCIVEGIVNKQDSEGLIPLFHAACSGHLEVVKLLFEHGANLMHSSHLSPIIGALLYLALVPYHVMEDRLRLRTKGRFGCARNKFFNLNKILAEHSSHESPELSLRGYDSNCLRHVGDCVDDMRWLEYFDSILSRHIFSRLCDDLEGSTELVNLLIPSESEDIYKHLTMFPAEFQPMHSLVLLITAVRGTSTVQSVLSSVNMNKTLYHFTDSDSFRNSIVFSRALELAPVRGTNSTFHLFENFLLQFIPNGGIYPSQMFFAASKGYWFVVEALATNLKARPDRHSMESVAVDPYLETCHLAVRSNRVALVNTLLQTALSRQLLTPQWWPHLISAAVHSNCSHTIVSSFISAGCDCFTCIKPAVKWGKIKTIDLLLDSLTTMKEHFRDLLIIAAEANQQLVVQRLDQFYRENVEIEIDLNFSRSTSFWLLVLQHSVRNGHQSLALEAIGYISERDTSTIVSQNQTIYHDILYYSCYWGLSDLLPCIPYSPSTLLIRQTHESPLEAAIANGRLGSVHNTPSNFPLGDDISAWLKEGPLVSATPQSKYCKCTCFNTRSVPNSLTSDYLLHVTLLSGGFHQMLSLETLQFHPEFTDAIPCNTVLCRNNAVPALLKLLGNLSGTILVFALKECQLDLLNGAVIADFSILLEQILRVLLSSECLSEYCAFSGISYVHKAVELGHTACLKLLLRSGDVFVNQLSAINSNGDNILHCAVTSGGQSVDTLTVVLEWVEKSSYEMCFAHNNYGDTPITLAFQLGKYERASKLLSVVAQWRNHWQQNSVIRWFPDPRAMKTRGWLCAMMSKQRSESASDLKIHSLPFNIRAIKRTSRLFKEAIHFGNSDVVSAMLISSCGLILTDKDMLRIGLLNSNVIKFLGNCPNYMHVKALDATSTVCKSITRRHCSNEVIELITLVQQNKVPISLDLDKVFITACGFSRLTLVQYFLSNGVSLSAEIVQKGVEEALYNGSCEVAAATLLSCYGESINSLVVDVSSWTSNVFKLIFVREKNTLDYQTIVEDLFGSLARPENIRRLSFSEEWLVHKWGEYQKLLFEKMAGTSRTPSNPWMLGVKWRDIAHTVEITIDWESFATCLLDPPLTKTQQNTPLLVEAIVFSSSVLGQLCLTEDNENHVYNLAYFFNCLEPLKSVVISAIQWPHTPSVSLASPSEGLLSLSYKQHDRVFVFPPCVVEEGTDRAWDESYSTDSGMHSLCVTDTSINNTHNTSTSGESLDLCNFYQKKLKKIHHTSISIAIEAGLMNQSVIMTLIDWCSEAIQLSSLPTTTFANIQSSDQVFCLPVPPPKKLLSHVGINIDSGREVETCSSVVSLVDGGLDFSIALATNTSPTNALFDSLLQQTISCTLIREVEILQRRFKRLITTRLIPCFQHVLRCYVDGDSVTILFEDLNGTLIELNHATVSHIHILKAFHKIRVFCDNFCDILNAYSHKPKLLASISTSFQRGFELVISEVSSTNITIDASLPACLTVLHDDLYHPKRGSALLAVTESLLKFAQETKQVTGVKTWLNDVPCPFLTHVDLKRSQKFLYPTVGVPSNLFIQLVSYGGDKLNLPSTYKCCLEVKISSSKGKSIRASSSEEPSSSSASTKLFVTASIDGQFKVVWNPSDEGLHSITLTLNGVEIQESFRRVFVDNIKALANNSGKRQICAGSHLTFIAAHVGCKCPFSSQESRVILTRDTVIEPSMILKNVPGYKPFIRLFKHTKSSLSSSSINSDRLSDRLRAAVSPGTGEPIDSPSDSEELASLPFLHHISITAAHGGSKQWIHTASHSVTVHTARIDKESKAVLKHTKKRSTVSRRIKRSKCKRQSSHCWPMHTQGSCTSVSLGNGMYRVSLQCIVAGSYKVFASCPLCQSVMKIYWLDKKSFYPQLYYVLPGPFSTKTSAIRDMNIGNHPGLNKYRPGQHGFYVDCYDEYGNSHTVGGSIKKAVVKGAGHLSIKPIHSLSEIQSCMKREDSECVVTDAGGGRYSFTFALLGAGIHSLLVTDVMGKTECFVTLQVINESSPWPPHCWLDPSNTYKSKPFKKCTNYMYLYDRYYNTFQGSTNGMIITLSLDSHSYYCELQKVSKSTNHYMFQFIPQIASGCYKLKACINNVCIADEPKDFEVKSNWESFRKLITHLRRNLQASFPPSIPIIVQIDRSNILESALQNHASLKYNHFRVRFLNEDGIDQGALSREFFHLLSQELVNPHYALFHCTNGLYKPSVQSSVNPSHLEYFNLCGKMMARMICDDRQMVVHFTPAVYKYLLEQECTLDDLKIEDPSFYKGLMEITLCESEEYLNQLAVNFTASLTNFGSLETVELEIGGKERRVTLKNRHQFVEKLCTWHLIGSIRKQLSHMHRGFYEIIPNTAITILQEFHWNELQLFLCGQPAINVSFVKSHTQYDGYTTQSNVVIWLWEILEHFSQEEWRKFLLFVTGSACLPADESTEWTLHVKKSCLGDTLLPTAATCFNTLYLPQYSSQNVFIQKFMQAISYGHLHFLNH